MSKPKSEYTIQTVSNALRILEAFDDDVELGVSELSRRLDLHKNNVFRLLATLEQRGYIEQCPRSDEYRLGSRCLQLGRSYARGHSLLRRTRPVLEALAADVGETAHLAVLSDGSGGAAEEPPFEVVHLDGEQPQRQILSSLRIGEHLPAHSIALGKVLLGCADEQTRERYDRSRVAQGLEPRTDSTICDPAKLFEELRTVAGRGYALDQEEFEPGMSCAAAPVLDGEGRLVAALSVSGPAFRLDERALHMVVAPLVQRAADTLSADLGYCPE